MTEATEDDFKSWNLIEFIFLILSSPENFLSIIFSLLKWLCLSYAVSQLYFGSSYVSFSVLTGLQEQKFPSKMDWSLTHKRFRLFTWYWHLKKLITATGSKGQSQLSGCHSPRAGSPDHMTRWGAGSLSHPVGTDLPTSPLLTAHWVNQLDKAGELAQVVWVWEKWQAGQLR